MEDSPFAIGDTIERYTIESVLGSGGMAVVYRVRHESLGTRHALKVLTHASRAIRERTLLEGKVQANLRHENLINVTDVLNIHGSPGLLMELAHGPSLDRYLQTYQPSLEEALTIFRGIVCGIGYAHANGLIHRDLKPGNIVLHVDHSTVIPKIMDFGLVKDSSNTENRTRTGAAMGTPTFMAPEQIRDASRVDRRADIYSLGCIFYQLLSGQQPFYNDDLIVLFNQIAAGECTPIDELVPDLPHEVRRVIALTMEVDRTKRLGDAQGILDVLSGSEPTITEVLGLAPPATTSQPTRLSLSSSGGVAAFDLTTPLQTVPPASPRHRHTLHEFANPTITAPSSVDSFLPPESVDDSPKPAPTPKLAGARVRWVGPMVVLLAGAVCAGALLVPRIIPEIVPDSSHPVTSIEPTQPPTPSPTPAAPREQPEEPPSTNSPIQPSPRRKPVGAPAPKRKTLPVPVPVRSPAPIPSPVQPVKPTPPPVTPASFQAQGGIVTLHGQTGVFSAGEEVPPGVYTWHVVFEDTTRASGGPITAKSGQALSFLCDSAFGACRVN